MNLLSERLMSWAQNEEMVDQGFTEHGKDCVEAAERIAELERGEYICKKCGLRKDAEFKQGDF